MLKRFLLLSLLCSATWAIAQPTAITLEGIWKDYAFSTRSVPGFSFQEDGLHYTRLEKSKVVQYDLTTGEQSGILFDGPSMKGQSGFSGEIDDYSFSAGESKMLVQTDREAIYRHSSKGFYYIVEGNKLNPVFPKGKIMNATLNPQGNKVAFVYENNVYIKDLSNEKVTQVTKDGLKNSIINGALDWVYEEEFSFWQGIEWSTDGQKIAYYRFDESAVPEFTMTLYKGALYPEYETFKYPKVGAVNSIVDIYIYDTKKGKSVKVDVGAEKDQYIPRIKWTPDPNKLVVQRLNRLQNKLDLLSADAKTGKTQLIMQETNQFYIDIHDNLTFVNGGRQFLWTSEQDGFNHIYRYNIDGSLDKQLTKGNWEVTEFLGFDEIRDVLYFQAAKESPLDRAVYALGTDGNMAKMRNLTPQRGWNSLQFSSTFDYFVLNYSNINTPNTYTVLKNDGTKVRVIEDNKKAVASQQATGTSLVEFFEFTTPENVQLNGWMMKPVNFDATKKHPVFMYLYGGPGSQQVKNSWKGQDYWWFQMLVQQGYVVACVDNRGTGGRGETFKKMTYLQLGKYETIDQIAAAKYLGNQPWADANRIGIFGWSYGGFMSSNCLLKGNDVFKAAIAVAPVTSWKWYDSIYTERYMQTEKDNPSGYKDNSPVYFADRLRGNYLLVHGMGDDNVHFQHAAEMMDALITNNKQFDTYAYPNKNHGIYGGLTRLHLYTKMTQFLNDKLMNDTRPLSELP